MKIMLTSWDDVLTVETSTGTKLHITPLEVKKRIGLAGTTDRLKLTVSVPVRVGKPFKSYGDERILHILVGEDHRSEIEPLDAEPVGPLDAEELAELESHTLVVVE